MKGISAFGIIILGLLSFMSLTTEAQFHIGFYAKSCPKAEKIAHDFVNKHIYDAPSLAAALIRMHFHYCFVRGCDASVLLNSTSGEEPEKASPANVTLRGFDFIDRVKSLVEAECPGIVSCADILTLAGRDSIVAIECNSRLQRHYYIPYENRTDFLPLIIYRAVHAGKFQRVEEMDPGSRKTFDLSYYSLLLKRRGLFESYAALTTNSFKLSMIHELLYAPPENFYAEFGQSMEKMGRINVKTGSAGEIRKHCAHVNA